MQNSHTSQAIPHKRAEDYVSVDFDFDESASTINTANVYGEHTDVDIPDSATEDNEPKAGGEQKMPTVGKIPRSQFNPYFNIRIVGSNAKDNYPKLDTDVSSNDVRFQPVTAASLIDTPRGASIYAPEDFIYMQNYDKLKLNRLITLRRFAHPCIDDIFNDKLTTEPDICRLLTFADSEENKFSDILKLSFGLNWKQLTSESSKMEMQGADDNTGITGMMGVAASLLDPQYGHNAMKGSARLGIDPQYDNNRVYGPVDSIASTHIRDIGVNFEQKIDLTFRYEMKSFNGINQKAAFIDLLSNIFLMGTNDAKFWGGARYWIGARPSKYMNMLKSLDSTDWKKYTSEAYAGMTALFKKYSQPQNAKEMLKNIANNALNLAFGSIINKLGRTGIPMANSLLTGNPVGLWHLTVGNPLNPILVAGDLIAESTEVTFGDELGFDDFPTEIIVKISLKNAKPRGRAEIENMFNCGKGRVYLKPENVIDRIETTRLEPQTLSSIQRKDISRFGTYNSEAIKRNSSELWSFLHDKKKRKK